MKLILYGTQHCHLCDEAQQLIRSFMENFPDQNQWETVDIALSEELVDCYGVRIPVLKNLDTAEELGWPFDAEKLHAFLQVEKTEISASSLKTSS